MANASKHAHWSEYDEKLEQSCWDKIQTAVEAGAVPSADPETAATLSGYARSSGYGEADSHVSDLGIEAPEDESAERAARREMFDAYMDGPYWNHIDRSQQILSDAAEGHPDPDAVRRGAASIAQSMRDAYESGRKDRLEMEAPQAAGPGR